jgi:DNA polymerase-3 subunit gamma/tau
MGQALYRKYRSKSLAELVGQEHITDTLNEALKSGRLSHAYLFTGPRGTGKTSIARILAHEVNGLPYDQEDNHIDIIEIDAASNRGIDEIRDLREKVYAAPVSAKYKVYIIDEVHMLTTPAFNALLKTLEEPPEHVIFVLATTEAHKLPETIISRTQRHVFRPVPLTKVVDHLKTLAKAENIKIDDDALQLIAEHGGGTFRDSISLLDQAGSSGKKITRHVAEQLLGIPPGKAIDVLLSAISTGTAAEVAAQLESLQSGGYHPASIAKTLSNVLRQEVLEGSPRFGSRQLELLGDLLEIAPAPDPGRKLELCLLAAMPPPATAESEPPQLVTAPPQNPTTPKPTTKKAVSATPEPKPVAPAIIEDEPISQDDSPLPATTDAVLDENTWQAILDSLKKTHNTLYGVMRMAVPEFEPGLLRLRFQFAFHQKRMNETKHRAIIVDIIETLTGQAVAIECVHDRDALVGSPAASTAAAPHAAEANASDGSLATVSNIFGGGELLES